MLFSSHTPLFPSFPDYPRSLAPTNSSVAFWSPESKNGDSNSGSRLKSAPIIYAVDDMPCLTELYGLILGKAGYVVKDFHDRPAALDSLRAAQTKPVLLITDLRNPTMRIEPFLEQCVAARPGLRILLVTGFSYHRAWCFSVKPDRFLPKPFTPEELRETVETMLAAEVNCVR